MQKNRYDLKFLSPAFLGDANQKGAWRVPPFKAMLREWWRIQAASQVRYSVEALRRLEQRLFGTAADSEEGNSSVSHLRMTLASWQPGKLSSWPPTVGGAGFVVSPDRRSSAEFYLGYGPLAGGPALKASPAIGAEESNVLGLAWPLADESAFRMDRVVALADAFATMGGRCRNGWGSLAMRKQGLGPQPCLDSVMLDAWGVLRRLPDCLQLDWPHAIGMDDEGPLVWESSSPFGTWREALGLLASVRLAMRRTARSVPALSARAVQPLDAIVYPTKDRQGFGRNARIANTLRFKLFRDEDGKLRVRVYHTPCRPPVQFPMNDVPLLQTWQSIHQELDRNNALERLA